MTVDWLEYAARQFEPPRRRWTTPGALAQHFDHRVRQTPALELIDERLVALHDATDGRLLLSMPPQEGKSQRVSRWFPLWALTQNPDLRIAIVSYEHNVARRWGRAIRDDIIMHGDQLGLRIRDDLGAQHEWQLDGHDGGVYTAGIGAALTGRPVDLLIIDDPIKDREQADSPTYRERAWSWWTDVGSTRLAPGAPVVQVATRWHEKDLAGQLMAAEDGHLWTVLNIPAEADHDPEQGQTDPLGRDPGEFMESARGRTVRQWRAIKVRSGSRSWASLFQGHPSPAEGDLFKRDGWSRYEEPLWIVRDDGSRVVPGTLGDDIELVQSYDFTFKDTKSSDFVVGQVWMRRGNDAYLLDQIRGRLSFTESCQAIRDLTARWPQAILKLVEDKANGPAILNALRSKVGGLVPVEPEGSKYARAAAVTPFVEAHNVHLPSVELAPWVSELVEEAAGFPNAAHDDQVDALSQAVHRLLLVPILDDETHDVDDLLDDDDLEMPTAWAATAY